MLSGTIDVNDIPVGYWEAVRGETIMHKNHRYACKVFYRNLEGHPMHAEFEIVHHEPLGAVVLAARVLSTGMKRLKGYPPGGPSEFPV